MPNVGTSADPSVVPTLDIFDGTDLGSLEGFTDVTEDGKFDGLLLGARLGLVDRLNINMDKVTELGF